MNYLDNRIISLRNSVLKSCSAVLITSDITRRYIFGFNSSAGFGYVSESRCLLFLDFRYYEKAKIMQKEGKIPLIVNICEITSTRKEILSQLMLEDKCESVMFEDKSLSYSEYLRLRAEIDEKISLIPAGNTIDKLRYIKDEYELSQIESAQEITDKAFSHILAFIKPGISENDISLELELFMRKCGADGLAFNTICVSGSKSSLPHGEPDNTVVQKGFLTMDFGAKYNGYCSDMTRTICIGKPTDDMIKVYDTVLHAQSKALFEIAGGVDGYEIDFAARKVINDAGYEGCFGHSTGHSLGLEIHEAPNFSPKEHITVPAGAVMSVEPGIYIRGKYGVRIEDIVFLTENGYKNLTNSTKEIIII